MRIYTGNGDAGLTDLANGTRVEKCDGRVEAYGELDELSAALGLARAYLAQGISGQLSRLPSLDANARLLETQKQLSALAGWLASPGARFPEACIGAAKRFEPEIDALMKAKGPLTGFVMPGANPLEAALHLARTVARRAERRLVNLSLAEAGSMYAVDGRALAYMNRLSDWLFALARLAE